MSDITSLYTPSEAWDELQKKRQLYVREMAAAWSGNHEELSATARNGSFWRRGGKAKVHVPIAADIATVSADTLFCERPRFTIFDDATEKSETQKQSRLDELIRLNSLSNKLHEAAELAAMGGDVFFKINYDAKDATYPTLQVVSTSDALPEWRLGELICVHFFTVIKREKDGTRVWRLYERYERGAIISAVFVGDSGSLGSDNTSMLAELGLERELRLPIDTLTAVQVFNLKPSRRNFGTDNGRSDFEGMRDQMDALDEVMTSWLRDIRLGKARTIVPAEFLRRRSTYNGGDGEGLSPMFSNEKYTWEFDEDVETFVALDMANDREMKITPSQFEIRSEQHAKTVETLLRNIISMCGYSPQSFGLDISGTAQSGTALHIREKKTYTTRGKKINYWDAPLEHILTALLQLDRAIYHTPDIHESDRVQVEFPDVLTSDVSTVATAVNLLHSAQAASTETLVKMLHPEWSAAQIQDEVEKVMTEYGIADPAAIAKMGEME